MVDSVDQSGRVEFAAADAGDCLQLQDFFGSSCARSMPEVLRGSLKACWCVLLCVQATPLAGLQAL